MKQHWSDIREAGALSGMRFMVWIYHRLGLTVFNIVLVPVMVYYFVLRTQARRASLDYLRRLRRFAPGCLPRGPLWFLSYRHFLGFGRSLLEKYQAWKGDMPTIAMDATEQAHLFEVVERRRGCLAIGSHLGNLEYSRGISRRHPGLILNVLLHDLHNSKFAQLMAQAEPDSRMNLIQVTEFDLPLTLLLKERVDRGEWVVMAGDRVPIGGSRRLVQANFLSDPANFPIGPIVMASVLRCPVYLLHCYKKAGQHHLGFEQFADRISLPVGDKEAELQQYMQRYATALEAQVVQAPLQWYNFFDFWEEQVAAPEQPPEKP